VDQEVHAVELLGVFGEGGVDVFVLGGVHGDEEGVFGGGEIAEGVDGAAAAGFVAFAGEVGEGDACAVLHEGLGDEPGVGTLVGDADDEADFSVQETHE